MITGNDGRADMDMGSSDGDGSPVRHEPTALKRVVWGCISPGGQEFLILFVKFVFIRGHF